MRERNLTLENYLDHHYLHRSNWLRAAVLGANDGIISISSLAIGMAAASTTREPIFLATVAGLVAGALSMAAGEYVSVSSQTDIEKADKEREIMELKDYPEQELHVLAQIYELRGLKKETAKQVALELTEKDALGAHLRDELGINEMNQANPIQAAFASGASFTVGGILPLALVLLAPESGMALWIYLDFSHPTWGCIRKSRWIQPKQSNLENNPLGNFGHGSICNGRIFFWSESITQ
jgi:VIT1/CCC1 family predicted Fe2+/Mn2+ transporter